MSKKETPLTRKYWQEIGGTLIEEFVMVRKSQNNGIRLIDGIIILNGENKILKQKEISLEGKDIIAIQTKSKRLGMNLMGQTLFSEQLLRKYHNPKSIISVALCTKDDIILRPLLENYPNMKVVIIDN
jgi:hypothetical protein